MNKEILKKYLLLNKQGKVADGVKNTSLSPALGHSAKEAPSKPSITDSPKLSDVVQSSDLSPIKLDISQSPAVQSTQPQKSATPLSSCSNSPSSVRINQNYDPNNLQKAQANENTNERTQHTADDASNGDCDLDNLEDADRKPLLNSVDNSQIVSNTKRTNSRYGKTDEAAARTDDGINESDTLISHN